jgi:DNA (cytosine-5)-methyltransferase 1
MKREVYKLGELFCGPGGLGYAASHSKIVANDTEYSIEHAWATDYDKDTCRTYRKNICPGRPDSVLCRDIRKLDIKSLKDISDIDALVFGFPCNDFSAVGKQKGVNGIYGPLYKYGVNVLEYFNPKWFLAENVGGLRNANEGTAIKEILQSLTEAGYNIVPHLYKFEEYGVPQARHRIIIVGIRKDLPIEFKIPLPTHSAGSYKTCREALENPPIHPNAPNQEHTKHSKDVIERLKYIKPGENAFTADIPSSLKLNIGGVKISQIYKRLHPDYPSYTITGSGGGGTHVYHWKENRALTNRERARLQTFPDDFEFIGSKESVRKQIGMAVPVEAGRVLFKAILQSFAGIEYPANTKLHSF